jgi:hypothetical protein
VDKPILQLLRWLDTPVIAKPFEVEAHLQAVEAAAGRVSVPVAEGGAHA